MTLYEISCVTRGSELPFPIHLLCAALDLVAHVPSCLSLYFCAVTSTWLCWQQRMRLWQQQMHQQILGSATPAAGPALPCRVLRHLTSSAWAQMSLQIN